MEPGDVFESPGEALLFLLGLPVFAAFFVVFVVLGTAGVSSRGLIPVTAVGQVGIVLEGAVVWRIARRLYPDAGWWELASRSGRAVAQQLWGLGTLRTAARIVARDIPGAVQAALRDRILTFGWIAWGLLMIGGTAALSLAQS